MSKQQHVDATTVDRLIIDGGTTTTRVWAVRGTEVLAETRATVGARDTARDGSPQALHRAVEGLLEQASSTARLIHADWRAEGIVAAGMITSPLGLAEVPHVPAPADLRALANGARELTIAQVSPLPILLLPGVRCGPAVPTLDDIADFDVMRGEEAVCLGMLEVGALSGSGIALSLGSHWKLVEILDGTITACSTTMGGEVLHVLRTQTVLSASVDSELPDTLSPQDIRMLQRGLLACENFGVLRAAFMTRLMERVPGSNGRERLLFLLGVVIGSTITPWTKQLAGSRVLLLGARPICQAWHFALTAMGAAPVSIEPETVTAAYVGALVQAANLAAQE
ncbi:2-dehydro-3-deoxygalactonokinase [Pseudoxanthomonas indica]|uniref:2-keto-3-deoxygalactonate kinase n=1 Tax=Pseudoxanthomonas indica TaxID=428993 RepID=A0A1T5LM80_9GAMM|nr:2-dehydro-3-deoxygalactonokinase [Pseudoxanthomonas indica]GGD36853.1 2-oxo-3-deoxygalactonate kinase [Pseudoxanthomonas indica]SKC77024.1 2-keto-3-deoxygalactonate kinase [Pseudoxanthomonas indica]